MSANNTCREIAHRLGAAGDEDLARIAREEAGHFETCRSCRAELALRDPSALFALLALESKDDAFFMGFETRVMAGIRAAEKETRGGWLAAILRPRYLTLAAGAGALALAIGLIARLQPPAPSKIAREPEAGIVATPQERSPALGLRPILERDAAPPSPVESVASATARVISIKVAGPEEPSDVVLIVDPEMPL